jgi:hypothetical protein
MTSSFKSNGKSDGMTGFSSNLFASKIWKILPGKGSIPLKSSKMMIDRLYTSPETPYWKKKFSTVMIQFERRNENCNHKQFKMLTTI